MFKVAVVLETVQSVSKGKVIQTHTVEVLVFADAKQAEAYIMAHPNEMFTFDESDPEYNLI